MNLIAHDYYRTREREHRAHAANSLHHELRIIHERLAQTYEELAQTAMKGELEPAAA